MRTADTVFSIIRERGQRGLPLERVQHLLYNEELYLRAYAKLYPNKGAMTQGITDETVDAMSRRKIKGLIDDLRQRTFRWTPVRRIYIPKKKGTRPLGIPTWKDKLLQEVIRSLLEEYYEPQFSNTSHGFRPGRGCHTALQHIQGTWTGTRWFLEGDISKYFDTINHDTLMEILGERIHDPRFLRLIRELLEAGYVEDWKFHLTLSGTPQGSVLSPLLANVYLDRFDQYVEKTLIPEYTRGETRRGNPAYRSLINKMRYTTVQGKQALRKQMRRLPAMDPHDPSYRRLRCIRYADDWLLGYDGTREEAEEIKRRIGVWLQENLKLTLSEEKTLITHAVKGAARFLGYQIVNQQYNNHIYKGRRRSLNGTIGLRIPEDVIEKQCAQYQKNGKPASRPKLLEDDDFSIVERYQQEYRGIVQYYLLAYNVGRLNKLRWIAEQSLMKTLACKHQTSVAAMYAKYKAKTQTPEGKTLTCLEVKRERENKPPLIARFGGISLTRQPQAVLNDRPYVHKVGRTELLRRLLADKCELCSSTENVEVHHIRKLADLKDKGGREVPVWKKIMAARRRKTLVVCHECHVNITYGRPIRLQISS